MGKRFDVRRMLLARGWEEDPTLHLLLRKDGVTWGSPGEHRGSCLSGGDIGAGHVLWTVDFPASVPASVIVAAAEAASLSAWRQGAKETS
jgi:hypothetical protein